MQVGMSVIFQNPDRARSDQDVYRDDLRLAHQAEALGFDSIWSVEHHFTDYTMCPDVLQFLSYMAGRTTRAKLGSMVVVLPWHDPIRVAEQVSLVDHYSDGRMILGIGRGLGRVEFEGFRVPMPESRDRFIEYSEMILTGLETGYCEYDGRYLKQPRRDLRPAPFRSFKGRTYAAAVSPESLHIMAKLGVGILIIPQKPWDTAAAELEQYRAIYRQLNGVDPIPCIAGGWTYCDENPDRAREMAERYIGGYWNSVIKHYEFASDHFAKTKGYEYYENISSNLTKHGNQGFIDFFLDLQVWGTPEQVYQKILDIRRRVANDGYIGVFSYAGMPIDAAERSMQLFAREVLPELKKLDDAAARQTAAVA